MVMRREVSRSSARLSCAFSLTAICAAVSVATVTQCDTLGGDGDTVRHVPAATKSSVAKAAVFNAIVRHRLLKKAKKKGDKK
jgi:hypothetical protein